MRRFWLILLIAVMAITAWFFFRSDKAVTTVQVTQGKISQTLVATGKVIPPATLELGSVISASIAQVRVDEGDEVTAGQPLIQLVDHALEASYLQATRTLQEAEQRLQELSSLSRPLAERTLTQAQSNLALAKAEHQRNLELNRSKLVAPQTLEQSKRTLDNAQSALETAQLHLSAHQETGITSKLLENKVAQAKAGLALAQAKLDQLTLRAPSHATVIARSAEVGATAQIGKPLLTLAITGVQKIELPIDEKNIRYLHLRQPAVVVADAYPKQSFSAYLSFISPLIDSARATINTHLIIDNPPDFLRHNMTVSVEIPIDHADNAYILSTDAIQDRDSDAPWVWRVNEQNKLTKATVKLGIQGVGDSQIIEGLTVNAWVVCDISPAKPLKEGMKVAMTPRVTRQVERPKGNDVPNGFK